MPTIVAAAESKVQVDGTPVDGVRAIDYRTQQARTSVYALGSTERIGVVAGARSVEGRLRVASTSDALNQLAVDQTFALVAEFQHGATKLTVSFEECFLTESGFALAVGEFGEAVYSFTATRVTETVTQG